MLPGVPAGTCTPSQLHGVQVRAAINAHCCSGVKGPGPAHDGVPGVPHIGSAEAVGMLAKVPAPIINATAARNVVMRSRVRFIAISNLVNDGQIVSPRPDAPQAFCANRCRVDVARATAIHTQIHTQTSLIFGWPLERLRVRRR